MTVDFKWLYFFPFPIDIQLDLKIYEGEKNPSNQLMTEQNSNQWMCVCVRVSFFFLDFISAGIVIKTNSRLVSELRIKHVQCVAIDGTTPVSSN